MSATAPGVSLVARNVSHTYPGRGEPALRDVSLAVAAGGAVALVGESGSGKTTLLRCFNRMVEPDAGDVNVDGTNVRAQDAVALRRRLGYVPQNGGLLPHWTVAQNVGLVLRAMGRRAGSTDEAVARAMLLAELDPAEFGARYPRELSGGQRQRIALARALAAEPGALLLDEPFGALDAITRAEVQDAFLQVRQRLGVTTLFVTHDLAEAARMANAIVVMRAGRVEQRGTITELHEAPATEHVRALVARAMSAALKLGLVLGLLGATPSDSVAQPPTPPAGSGPGGRQRAVVVASKPFGESYVLAEMFAQVLESRGIAVTRRPGLGATEVAFEALRTGAIDVYPEYTGTGLAAVLRDTLPDSLARNPRAVFAHVSRRFAGRYGVTWLPPLGFSNTYAIAVRRETAERYRLRTLSDLARVSSELTAGFTADFLGRADGLPGLGRIYGMRFRATRPLAPALKYRALADGGVDVVDGYSTDGLLSRYDLVVLDDDRGFFPPYEAAALVSARVARDRPDVMVALTALSGRLDESRMRSWNRRVEVDRAEVAVVARDALREILGDSVGSGSLAPGRVAPGRVASGDASQSFAAFMSARRGQLLREIARHLQLVLAALVAAIVVAVPLGLALERARRAAEPVIGALGVLQTIPSIALLAFMIPLFGIGVVPALVALWLYALYPIARGTYTGVRNADSEAVEAAVALGTTPRQRLLWVRLPLAMPTIMAGVRTSAVITIGAATLAAFIGAGGLGEPIVQGLALADSRLILAGAIPAAVLALLMDGALALVERRLRPRHLR